MKKLLRWILYSVFGLILISFITLFFGSIYIQKNKKEILSKINTYVEKKYHSNLNIQELTLSLIDHFPNFSIRLEDVDVKGPMFNKHHQKIFSAELISLEINTQKLLRGKIEFSNTRVKNGNIFIFTDKEGKSNLSEFSQKNKESKKTHLPEQIELKNIDLQIINEQKRKAFQFLINTLKLNTKDSKENYELNIKKDIVVKKMIFNHKKGSFLKDQNIKGDYSVVYSKNNKILYGNNISLSIGGNLFVLKPLFELKENGRFQLSVKTESLPYKQAGKILTGHIRNILNNIQISNPLKITSTIEGPLANGEPHVVAKWYTEKTNIGSSNISLTNATLIGTFNNQIDTLKEPNDLNTEIYIDTLRGMWHQITVSGNNLIIRDLKNPHIEAEIKSNFELAKLNNAIGSSKILLKKGNAMLDLNYKGPLKNFTEKNTELKGQLTVDKGEVFIKPLNKQIMNANIKIGIYNNNIEIKKFEANTKAGSKINITGISTNTLSAIPGNPGKANIQLRISSPFLDLNDFSSTINHSGIDSRKTNTLSKIDHLLENENINIHIYSDKIQWNKLNAEKLESSIVLKSGDWYIKNLTMGIDKGRIKLNAQLSGRKNKKLNSEIKVENIKIEKLLYGLDNLGLKGISYQNIRGNLNLTSNIAAFLNKNGQLIPNSMQASVNFNIKQGALINYEPLLLVQENVFKKRHLDSLKFAEISNQINLKNGQISIPRMEIATTAFNLFVGGEYRLDGNTNLHIQVPINNIFQRNQKNKMAKASNSEKGGISVFLLAKTDKNGKTRLKLDPNGVQFKKNQLAK